MEKKKVNTDGWMFAMNEFAAFAKKTFKRAHPITSLQKLDEEIKEVAHEIRHGHENLAEEYADCIMCLIDSAARMKITPEMLFEAFTRKLEVNKSRKWKRNKDGTYSHIKHPASAQ